MVRRLAPLALIVLVASCTGTPSTTKPTKSASPGAKASAGPTDKPETTAPTATPTAGAPADAATSLSVSIDGAPVTVANTFKYGGSGKTIQWTFDKPSGFAPADKWYFDVGVNGKTTKPVKIGFTVDDVSSVALDFRQGTGPTSQERVYSTADVPVSAITIADGKVDLTYKGTVDKLGFGAGGAGGPDKITVDVKLMGLPLP
jgi:hypothetical protein